MIASSGEMINEILKVPLGEIQCVVELIELEKKGKIHNINFLVA